MSQEFLYKGGKTGRWLKSSVTLQSFTLNEFDSLRLLNMFRVVIDLEPTDFVYTFPTSFAWEDGFEPIVELSHAWSMTFEKWRLLERALLEGIQVVRNNYTTDLTKVLVEIKYGALGDKTCGLCRLFIDDGCVGCPIDYANRPNCLGTPVIDLINLAGTSLVNNLLDICYVLSLVQKERKLLHEILADGDWQEVYNLNYKRLWWTW